MTMKYIVKDKPSWELEAVCSIAGHFKNEVDKVLENSSKFGFTKEEMHNFLDKYITYRDAVAEELIPIFDKKYNILEPYFKPNGLNNSMIVGLVQAQNCLNKLSDNVSNEDIDEMAVDILNSMADELRSEDETNYNFSDLGNVIGFLNKLPLDNNFKMQIINFYMDRYNLIGKLVELIDECAPICEKYFFIIKEEFDQTVNFMRNVEDIDNMIKSYVSINCVDDGAADIYINIHFFNQMSMRMADSANAIIAGIHIFKLCELSEKNKYNDVQMVAKLKALADATRYKIICMLSEESMYMQEIADKLGLTAANVSHHINILLQQDIISIIIDTEKNKRIYYELNGNKIVNLTEALNNIIKK